MLGTRPANGAARPLSVLIGLIFAFLGSAANAQSPDERPNIVMILVDDAAFMDFGGYGGEARTPNIDRLADAGVRFSNYRTSPLCSPSRAMLLTGVDNHQTGVATIPEVLTPGQKGRPGYVMHLEPGVETVAEKLRRSGYRTYMTGKWHLGDRPEDLPSGQGFDRSFALDASGADNWEQKSYMPYYKTAPWFEDGEPADLPEDFYSSKFIVDKMIEYLSAEDADDAADPFFAYLAFQAIHIPIQAPREIIDSYDGVYDAGWDALRDTRWRKAKALGLIHPDAPAPNALEGLRAWDDLSEDEQLIYARSMQVNAAMLEAMDLHIGRLMDHLEAEGVMENTLFVVTSDNGPEHNDPVHATGMDLWMATHGYSWDLKNLGGPGSLAFIGTEWAVAASSPGSLFKFFMSEGGVRVPLIMSGPGIAPQGFVDAFAHVTDVTPTVLDLARASEAITHEGVAMSGRSLRPILEGAADEVYAPGTPVGMEVSGNAALMKDGYKILRVTKPYGDNTWRLYNVALDPGETEDLSAEEPERMAQMLSDYEAYAERVGVIAPPQDFNVLRQILHNSIQRQLSFYGGHLIVAGVCLLGSVSGGIYFWIRRRRKRRLAA